MNRAPLVALLSMVSLAACVSDPVKKGKTGQAGNTGTIAVMTGGAAGTTADPTGTAGTDPTGAAGTAPDPTGAAGSTTPPDPGAAGSAGDAGSSGAAGSTGDAGSSGAAGSAGAAGSSGAAGATGSAGTTGSTDAGASDSPEVTTPTPAPITDPCDHRAWVFTPSVVCTTACAAMADAMKLPANAIDGNTATRYTTGITQGSKGPELAILTFPKPVTLTGINLVSKNGDGPISYLVEWSTDGANFSFFTPSAAGAGSDNLTVTFPAPTKALALRITQTGVKKTNWWSVHELTVAGCAAAP
jgi:F5/8 type C domain/Collagen triple helix repeat (20 copies)